MLLHISQYNVQYRTHDSNSNSVKNQCQGPGLLCTQKAYLSV